MLARAYKDFVKGSNACWLQRALLEIYCDNADEVLYKLVLWSSFIVASQRRTQWDYEWGEGNSGKDMGHGVLCAFLGDGSNRGYAEKLAVESLTRPGQIDPNGAQSMKHARRGVEGAV